MHLLCLFSSFNIFYVGSMHFTELIWELTWEMYFVRMYVIGFPVLDDIFRILFLRIMKRLPNAFWHHLSTIAGSFISSQKRKFLFASVKAKPIFVVRRDPFSLRTFFCEKGSDIKANDEERLLKKAIINVCTIPYYICMPWTHNVEIWEL